MADYYPLLARALDGLSDRSPAARQTVYERARSALRLQLDGLKPPLPPAEIARETAALEAAIERAEEMQRREAAETAPLPPDPPAEIQASEARGPAEPPQPAIRRGGRRGRSLWMAVGLVVLIAPIAVVAWLWRDRPQPAVPTAEAPRPAAPAPSPGGEPKFPERVGGAGSPSPASPSPSGPAQPAPAGQPAQPAARPPAQPPEQTPPPQPELPVAQRAALIEEDTANPQQPRITPGRVLWRLDAVNGGQGQPLETVIRASVEVPEAEMSLALVMRRNRDATLPASHTIELTFMTKPGDAGRMVRDVGLPLMQIDERQQGIPLAGLPVPVKDNVFLIGLSDLKSEVERNTELIVKRDWMQVPIRFASGQRALLLFEKGVSGDRVVTDAFKQWLLP